MGLPHLKLVAGLDLARRRDHSALVIARRRARPAHRQRGAAPAAGSAAPAVRLNRAAPRRPRLSLRWAMRRTSASSSSTRPAAQSYRPTSSGRACAPAPTKFSVAVVDLPVIVIVAASVFAKVAAGAELAVTKVARPRAMATVLRRVVIDVSLGRDADGRIMSPCPTRRLVRPRQRLVIRCQPCPAPGYRGDRARTRADSPRCANMMGA